METGPGTTARDATGSDPTSPTDPSQTTTPTTQTTLEPTDTSSDSTAGVGPGTSETGTGSEESGGSTTGEVQGPCSTYDQDDCPVGEKCMPWATDDGGAWDALGCFLLDADPGSPGDSCIVFETATSGLDNCDGMSMCWDVDTRTGVGACVPFCSGSADDPACAPDHSCVQRNDGVLALCLPLCDPLVQECDEGSACLPDDNGGYACVPDASGDGGAVGDACEFINVCNPGNFCAEAEFLDDCATEMCCTMFCDLADTDICTSPSVCVAYYEEGAALPGYEDVGFCGAV